MKLWLDDIRNPEDFGRPDWVWCLTANSAILTLRTGKVEEASLDHDLGPGLTGYDVVCWLERHPEFWPKGGVRIHSANPVGSQRMRQVIDRHYNAN